MSRPAPLLLLALAACGAPAPRRLALGEDRCSHCHMVLADARFAAELVTKTGKVYPFDDAGCMASFVAGGPVETEQIHSMWVGDFTRPDSLIRVERAVFVRHPALRSPMDHGIVAVASRAAAETLRAALGGGGEPLDWAGVLAVVGGTGKGAP